MKKIVGIGFDIPGNKENYIKIDSNESLSDHDIAIFYPDLSYTRYYGNTVNEGKMLYDKTSSTKIIGQIKHWKNEINSFLSSGKTLFVVMNRKVEFYVYSGYKSFRGTGNNQKEYFDLQLQNNYDFLPYHNEIINSNGKIILPVNPLVNNFYNNFKDFIRYEVFIHDYGYEKLFSTRNNDKVLGAYSEINKGYLVFIPFVDLNEKTLLQKVKGTKEELSDEKALQIGKIFIQNLIEIENSIRKEIVKTPKPSWTNNDEHILLESKKTLELINLNKKEILDLEKRNEKLIEKYNENESLKDLLFETGKLLEQAVIRAMQILGFHAENYDDGKLELDQVITGPENIRYIGECEGKDKKDIDINKFRQLQDSLNEDFERPEVDEKAYGLLFGNSQRLIAPEERSIGFTTKCQMGAEREKIGLIRTSDLFRVCKHIMDANDEEFKILCRRTINEQLGKVIKFPEIPSSPGFATPANK